MRYFAFAAIALFFGALIAGSIVIGSPAKQRDMRFDEKRVADLQGLEAQIIYYWQTKGILPESLATLSRDIPNYRMPTDPMTGSSYEYRRLDTERSFILCAYFSLPGDSQEGRVAYDTVSTPVVPRKLPKGGQLSWNWKHAAGNECFTRMIDPDFFPPIKPAEQQPPGD